MAAHIERRRSHPALAEDAVDPRLIGEEFIDAGHVVCCPLHVTDQSGRG